MSNAVETWEGVAASLLQATGLDDGPVDALDLAALCGLTLAPTCGNRGELVGNVLRYNTKERPTRQHAVVAHELGHWALQWAGEDDSEQGATYVGHALLLPRRRFSAVLRRTLCPVALGAVNPLAPVSWIVRRAAQLRLDTVATIADNNRVTERYSCRPAPQLSDSERALLDYSLRTGAPASDERSKTAPVFDGPWRRIVMITRLD